MPVRLLLDEHYPGWLALRLGESGVDASTVSGRAELRGADDLEVLRAAVDEGRVVVTEDVTTFSAAAAMFPDRLGIVFCHHARFPRTRPGLARLQEALVTLAHDPPPGLGAQPIVWWL